MNENNKLQRTHTISWSTTVMVQLTTNQRTFVITQFTLTPNVTVVENNLESDFYRVFQKNPKTIENDLLLEFQCLAIS